MTPTSDVPILLDPRLGLSAQELAAAWNADPSLAQQGSARVESAPPASYDLGAVVLVVASSVVLNVLSSIVYDLAKEGLRRARKPDELRRFEVQIEGKTYIVLAPEE